jgi:hypothetical protein
VLPSFKKSQFPHYRFAINVGYCYFQQLRTSMLYVCLVLINFKQLTDTLSFTVKQTNSYHFSPFPQVPCKFHPWAFPPLLLLSLLTYSIALEINFISKNCHYFYSFSQNLRQDLSSIMQRHCWYSQLWPLPYLNLSIATAIFNYFQRRVVSDTLVILVRDHWVECKECCHTVIDFHWLKCSSLLSSRARSSSALSNVSNVEACCHFFFSNWPID